MGIIINCILLMLSAVVCVLGISFFLNNGGTDDKTSYYILFLSIFAAIWCATYGSIGITDDLELAAGMRMPGVFAINAFLVTEVFLFTGLSRMRISISHILRTIVIVVAFADFIMYSDKKADLFIRIGNWTTWSQNPDMSVARTFHSNFILLYFLILLGTGITWARKNKLPRQKRFISLMFASNFIMIFFTLPDTFMPMMGYYPVATSGIGAALCAIGTWVGATRLNSFNIRMGTISSLIYENINAGAVVFDTNQRIVMANPYAINSSGMKTLEGAHIGDLFQIGDEKEMFDQALVDKYNIRLEARWDDKVYAVSLSAAKDDYGDPYCFICVFTDVTDEAEAIRELEVANNAKTEFLTSISHEIRTPINSIIGFNEMIIRDSQDEEIRGYAGNSDRASRQLLSIVNDLLDMSQITSGKLKIQPEEYELGALLRDVRDMQSLRAEEKGLTFSVDLDESIPGHLMGDEVRLQQIITNFVTNAIKYTNEGSVRLGVSFRWVDRETIILIIRVSDTGIGIREENIPHLYDTFSRFDKEAHKYIEGTGVGLSVTKSIVDMMEGTIGVDSTYGKGTTFTVNIPQSVVENVPVGNLDDYTVKKVKSAKITYRAPRASILTVDDNEMNRMVFRGMVRPLGLTLDEADSGRGMLDLIKEKKYDIIFLDHMMPQMDGVEALKRMRSDGTHLNTETPVIVMTANAGRGAREKYMEIGFDDYVSKPTNAKELLSVIKKYLPEDLVEKNDDVSDGPHENEAREESKSVIGQKLAGLDGVDWKAARSTSSDDDVLHTLIEKFCFMAPRELAELDSYYAGINEGTKDSVASYRIKVHSMKNSAALVGALGLSAKALELEQAADREDTEAIKIGHDAFCREYKDMADRIREAVLGEVGSDARTMDDGTLSDNLDVLEKAMSDLDMTTINEKVFEMSDFGYSSPDIEKFMEELFTAIRDYDTDRFDSLIQEIRTHL